MNIETLQKVAETALLAYSIGGCHIKKVGHLSGHVKYLVETNNEKYLLSVHYPISHKKYVPQAQEIESLLLWIEALHVETDIVVQQPIQNKLGDRVTQITLRDKNESSYLCTLLTWIDGDTIKTPLHKHIKEMGTLMAMLHQHAQEWELPNHIERPLLDKDELNLSLNKLKVAKDDGRISKDHFNILANVSDKIGKLYLMGDVTRKDWGLLHNDLMPGNCLWHGEEIRPIDFDNCCFGYYLYDMAWVLQIWTPDLRKVFLEGYTQERVISQDDWSVIEAFMIMSKLRSLSWWVGNENHRFEHVPAFAEGICQKFIDGDPFLFAVCS